MTDRYTGDGDISGDGRTTDPVSGQSSPSGHPAPPVTDGGQESAPAPTGSARYDASTAPTSPPAEPVVGETRASRRDRAARGQVQDGENGATAATRTEDPDEKVGPGRAAWIFLRETVIVVALALLLSFVAKTWLVQSFWIPSDSMNNTLIKADRVVVNKLAPDVVSLKRGDIVVFTDPGHWLRNVNAPAPERTGVAAGVTKALTWVGLMPNDEGNHLIKRVIGLPGDHVVCCDKNGKLTVNGVAINEPYIYPGDVPSELDFNITVPQGKVWVMGDHRSDSADSRYNDTAADASGDAGGASTDPKDNTGYYGSVPIDDVVGVAFTIVWPLDRAAWLGNPGDTFATVPAPTSTSTTKPAATPSSS